MPLGHCFLFLLDVATSEYMSKEWLEGVNAPWALFFISTFLHCMREQEHADAVGCQCPLGIVFYFYEVTELHVPEIGILKSVNAPWALFFISTEEKMNGNTSKNGGMCQCPLGIVFYFYFRLHHFFSFANAVVSMPLGHCFLFLPADAPLRIWGGRAYTGVNAPWALFFISTDILQEHWSIRK